ncbi:hypothetical protein ZWY2020_041294 [Hordeum vulgare]|nr:hypothetical protein ZWY2020_041294 [Hordeum vulgare]
MPRASPLLLLIPTTISLLLLYERCLSVAINPIQRKDLPARIASQIEREGKDVTITAFSKMVGYALQDVTLRYCPRKESVLSCDMLMYVPCTNSSYTPKGMKSNKRKHSIIISIMDKINMLRAEMETWSIHFQL